MQEIADNKNLSKARVGVIIKNVEKKLDKYEETLKIASRNESLKEMLKVNDLLTIKREIEKLLKGE